ncbi:TRAPP trafficking subunit Trs65-domain-containing protein [Elsinoe ampelina]|uniref:TRAPP trafficking subunit Trs65-domain-containing protein n=1 Tax=Elsinoe ampelina TaxID=302913 RepID=A0A6A6GB50_9PEZI|nr:TRAPP trafficking subunit Trs65-domain-containing protein [Elsinoe ampelina]
MSPSPAEWDEYARSKLEIITPGGQGAAQLENISYDDVDTLRKSQRSHYFYDEILPVVITFRSRLSELSFRSCLQHSHLSVSAHLQALSPQQEQNPSGAKQDPTIKIILGSFSNSAATPNHVHSISTEESVAIFAGELHLHHPERQSFRPSIYFAASMHFDIPRQSAVDPLDDYLPSGIPLPANILSPLLSSPAFAGKDVNLSASRLDRVIPFSAAPPVENKPIRGATGQHPIAPSLLLRTSRTLFPDQVYLSVDTQVPMYARSAVKLEAAEARLPSSTVKALSTTSLPATLKPGDRTTFIFQTQAQAGASIAQYRLTASLTASQGTKINLVIRRNLNAPAGAKVPTRERIKYWSVPKGSSRPSSSIAGPRDAHDGAKKGLKITINAPNNIKIGTIFNIHFFVINNGGRKRRLSILGPASPVPSKGANRSSWVVSRASKPAKGQPVKESIASAVTDSRELQSQISGAKQSKKLGTSNSRIAGQKAEIVTLDPEVRLGTMQPGACYEVSMKVQALGVGVVSIEGMVIADLDSRETCLIGEGWEGICYNTDEEPNLDFASGQVVVSPESAGEEADLLIPDAPTDTTEDTTALVDVVAES